MDDPAADLAEMLRRKTELEVDKLMLEIEKIRAEMRNDQRRVYWQMWSAIAATIAATGAIITATIALTKAFL